MTAKTALMADIHGNSPALEAVMEDIRHKECSQVFVLGDIINGVDPHGCIKILREWSEEENIQLTCIKGNAESYLLTPALDSLPRKEESLNVALIQLIQWYQAHLIQLDIEWIRSFPDFIYWNEACLVHDSPIDRLEPQSWHQPGIDLKYQEWFYHSPGIRQNMDEQELLQIIRFMQDHHLQQVFCGHTHSPFIRIFESKVICNVGSVGASLDGDPRAAWVLVEEMPKGNQTITICRVEYDVSRTHQMIDLTLDYPDFKVPGVQGAYKKWLASGIHWKAYLT
jgi:predicted phosphodiesterase